jgi:hypothetical protein
MALNSLSPAWIQLNYTSNGHQHRAILPCKPNGGWVAGFEPSLQKKDTTDIDATAAVAAYWNVAKPFFNTSSTLDSYYAYSRPTPSDPPEFIYTAPIGLAGTSAFATVPGVETVISFKTSLLGGLKLYLMEAVLAANIKTPLPTPLDAATLAFTDYVIGDDGWITGRNNQFPLAPLFLTTKLNDYYRRKYLL